MSGESTKLCFDLSRNRSEYNKCRKFLFLKKLGTQFARVHCANDSLLLSSCQPPHGQVVTRSGGAVNSRPELPLKGDAIRQSAERVGGPSNFFFLSPPRLLHQRHLVSEMEEFRPRPLGIFPFSIRLFVLKIFVQIKIKIKHLHAAFREAE